MHDAMSCAVFAVVPLNALCSPSQKPEETGFGSFDGKFIPRYSLVSFVSASFHRIFPYLLFVLDLTLECKQDAMDGMSRTHTLATMALALESQLAGDIRLTN